MKTHPWWRQFETPSDDEIARARVGTYVPAPVLVVPYDPAWPADFERIRAMLRTGLGDRALRILHVGSTSVPGLAAKPVIDVDLIVTDSADEAAYLPDLERLGFALRGREPEWEEHRLLKLLEPDCNLHVFGPDAIEPRRNLAFAQWLREHASDREAYSAHKRAVAALGFTDGMHYNNAKAAFVYDLYEQIFLADPGHPHDPHQRPGTQ